MENDCMFRRKTKGRKLVILEDEDDEIPPTLDVSSQPPTQITNNVEDDNDIPSTLHVSSPLPTQITGNADDNDIPSTLRVSSPLPTQITTNDDIPSTLHVSSPLPTQITTNDDIPSTLQVSSSPPPTQIVAAEQDEVSSLLPTQVLSPPKRTTSTSSSTCGICLADWDTPQKSPMKFNDEETVYIGQMNNCSHLFCYQCIFQWSQVTNTCPMCKAEFTLLKRKRLGSEQVISCIKVQKKKQRVEDEDLPPEYYEDASDVEYGEEYDDDADLAGFVVPDEEVLYEDDENADYVYEEEEEFEEDEEEEEWGYSNGHVTITPERSPPRRRTRSQGNKRKEDRVSKKESPPKRQKPSHPRRRSSRTPKPRTPNRFLDDWVQRKRTRTNTFTTQTGTTYSYSSSPSSSSSSPIPPTIDITRSPSPRSSPRSPSLITKTPSPVNRTNNASSPIELSSSPSDTPSPTLFQLKPTTIISPETPQSVQKHRAMTNTLTDVGEVIPETPIHSSTLNVKRLSPSGKPKTSPITIHSPSDEYLLCSIKPNSTPKHVRVISNSQSTKNGTSVNKTEKEKKKESINKKNIYLSPKKKNKGKNGQKSDVEKAWNDMDKLMKDKLSQEAAALKQKKEKEPKQQKLTQMTSGEGMRWLLHKKNSSTKKPNPLYANLKDGCTSSSVPSSSSREAFASKWNTNSTPVSVSHKTSFHSPSPVTPTPFDRKKRGPENVSPTTPSNVAFSFSYPTTSISPSDSVRKNLYHIL